MPLINHDFIWQDATLTAKQRNSLIQKDAQHAFQAGMQAWEEGKPYIAHDWLERAYRLAPESGHVLFALALARRAVHDGMGARKLLQNLVNKYDFKEGWVLLHHLWCEQGYFEGAKHALAYLLSSFSLTSDIQKIADQFCKEHSFTWCGLTETGQVQWGGVEADKAPILYLNHQRVALRKKGARYFCPAGWAKVEHIELVFETDHPVLGTPFIVKRIMACEGFVSAQEGQIQGWVWHPYAPEINPTLSVIGADGRKITQINTSENALSFSPERPATRYRKFTLPTQDMAYELVHIFASNRQELAGSPVVVQHKQRSAAFLASYFARNEKEVLGKECLSSKIQPFLPIPVLENTHNAVKVSDHKAPVAIIIPVYGQKALTLACLTSVQKTVQGMGVTVVVVNDASPEVKLVQSVKEFCKKNDFIFLSHKRNKGFPASVNTGLKAVKGHDVILLNSDTLVPKGWVTELQNIAYAHNDTGTVTPFSNKGGLVSYPCVKIENPLPPLQALKGLMLAVEAANKGRCADIPTGNGFCLYIRHDCLQQTGYFREDVFAQGYGEENDFCMRAQALGWRHKAALGVYVGHVGGASFGQSRQALMERNEGILEYLHPGYQKKIAAWVKTDPLWQERRRIDLLRLRVSKSGTKTTNKTVLVITHAQGGGVEQVVQKRVSVYQTQARRVLILRPIDNGCLIEDPLHKKDYPSLRFRLPDELALLKRLLVAEGVQYIEIHHLVGHHACLYGFMRNSGYPYTLYIHDYAFFCQRISLLGPEGVYCGEPEPQGCAQCIALAGHHLTQDCTVPEYLARSQYLLQKAQHVYVPSHDTATRIAKHFAGINYSVRALQNDKNLEKPFKKWSKSPRSQTTPASGALSSPYVQGKPARVRLCLIGAIGHEKGYSVLHQAALNAAMHDLPLEFVIVGHTPNDQLLLNTQRVFITGRYQEAEAVSLIQSFQPDAAFFPSLWPETWCLTLGLAWQAGLQALVFDHGAPAERVRQTGRGWLLNSKLRGSALNQVLIKTVLGCKNSKDGKNPNLFIKL
ncbi:MAG: glycosyltransferase [Acetobacter orientalis]|uniref:glycosyltransferase n=1 Tax=Acetobacter orientalis TaxID=146474 RepID=UPI0039EA6C62